MELPQLEPRVAVGTTIPGIQINENPKPEPARERTYDNYEKVELNNSKSLKNSSTIVITGSGDVLAFRKNIDQDPGIQDRKACFEQQMPRNTNKLVNSNEFDALEGRGEVLLTKNNNGVDAFPVTPSYPNRPSGKRPNYGTNGSKPPRMPSGFSKIPHKPVNQGGKAGGGPGAGNPGDNSNPDGPFLFDMGASNSNQCQDRMVPPQSKDQKKKKKQLKEEIKSEVKTDFDYISDEKGDPVLLIPDNNP